MKTNTILVTGGAGFVGSALVRELLEQTDSAIVVWDNFANGRRAFLPDSPRVYVREVDLTKRAAVLEAFDEVRPEIAIHLAAIHFIPYCNAHPDEALQVNVTGAQNFLDACRRRPPARVVIASTAAVYPIHDGANAEDDAVGPTDVYGLSKWVNERQLDLYARETPSRCAAARLFNVIGPRETNPHVLPEIVDQIRGGRDELSLGNVRPKRDYIHVADVARALLAIARKNEQSFRAYNVGTGSEYSVEEIVALLAQITGRPLTITVSSDRVRKAERMHLLCDTRRTREEIGWSARYDLESGLRDLWQSVTAEAALGADVIAYQRRP